MRLQIKTGLLTSSIVLFIIKYTVNGFNLHCIILIKLIRIYIFGYKILILCVYLQNSDWISLQIDNIRKLNKTSRTMYVPSESAEAYKVQFLK